MPQKKARKEANNDSTVSKQCHSEREGLATSAKKQPETKEEKVLLIAEAVRIVLRFLLKTTYIASMKAQEDRRLEGQLD